MSYRSEDIRTQWVWAIIFMVVLFFIAWAGSSIYVSQKRSLNPEVVKLQNELEKQREDDEARDKQQYIDGCKQSGKYPTDMGNIPSNWECG